MVLGRKYSVQAPPAVTKKKSFQAERGKRYTFHFSGYLPASKENLEDNYVGNELKLEMRISTISPGKQISSRPMQTKPGVSSSH